MIKHPTRTEERVIHQLLNAYTDATLLVEYNGIVRFVNPHFTQLLNYTPSQIQGSDIIDIIGTWDKSVFTAQWNALVESGKKDSEVILENVVLTDKGKSEARYEVRLSFADFAEGKFVCVSIIDKSSMNRLAAQRDDYQRFFEMNNDLACIANTKGFFEVVNPRFVQVLGYTEAELIQSQFFNFIHPDDIGITYREVEKLKSGAPTISFTNRYRKKNGEYLHLEWSAAPEPKRGKLYAVARDVTERKKLELQLHATNERLALALTAQAAGLWEYNLVDGTRWWDDQYYRLIGYQRTEIDPSEESIKKLVHPEDWAHLVKSRDDSVDSNSRFDIEIRVRVKGKGFRWFNVNGKVELDENQKPIRLVGTILDVHERKMAILLTLQLMKKNVKIKLTNYKLKSDLEKHTLENAAMEKILYKLFPRSIAKRVIYGEEQIVEMYKHCSVLFADIVGFTQWSSRMNLQELSGHLNHIFQIFDELSNRHGVEKIKTIGDAYMCAAGLPKPCKDHAARIARLAIAMNQAMRKHYPDGMVKLRIGIHTGTVIAGVLESNKFTFDLWGDTVNIASRMQTYGVAEKIHVTEEFKNLLKNSFCFDGCRSMDIKGKGLMKTYFLEGSLHSTENFNARADIENNP